MHSHVWLFATLWTVACQDPQSTGFSRQEYWSGLPFTLPEDLPDPRIKPHISCLSRWILYHWEAPIVGLLLTISPLFPFLSGLYNQIFFSFIFISWRLITLHYCSGFCHTFTWISHGFTCVPHPDPLSHLPLHLIPLGLPSAPGLSTCLMHPAWAGDLFHPR